MKKSLIALGFSLALLGPVHATESLSLAGTWRFEIAGTNAAGFARNLPGKIKLSGTIDDAPSARSTPSR